MNRFLVLAIFALAAGLPLPAPAWTQAAASSTSQDVRRRPHVVRREPRRAILAMVYNAIGRFKQLRGAQLSPNSRMLLPGFLPASINAYVALSNQSAPTFFLLPQDANNNSQPIATGPFNGTMRIVLSWGHPLDLDLHMRGPEPITNRTDRYHIEYIHPGPPDISSPPYAHLDHSDNFGFGLETGTIARFVPGLYHVYVHNNDPQDAPIVGSEARVDLYGGNDHVRTFYPPVGLDGQYWLLFVMDGATKVIDAENRMTNVEPSF